MYIQDTSHLLRQAAVLVSLSETGVANKAAKQALEKCESEVKSQEEKKGDRGVQKQ